MEAGPEATLCLFARTPRSVIDIDGYGALVTPHFRQRHTADKILLLESLIVGMSSGTWRLVSHLLSFAHGCRLRRPTIDHIALLALVIRCLRPPAKPRSATLHQRRVRLYSQSMPILASCLVAGAFDGLDWAPPPLTFACLFRGHAGRTCCLRGSYFFELCALSSVWRGCRGRRRDRHVG